MGNTWGTELKEADKQQPAETESIKSIEHVKQVPKTRDSVKEPFNCDCKAMCIHAASGKVCADCGRPCADCVCGQ